MPESPSFLTSLLSRKLYGDDGGDVLFEENTPRQTVVLHRVRVGREPSLEVLPYHQKGRNQRDDRQRQNRTEKKHDGQCKSRGQEHAQNRRQKVRPEIRDFFDRLLEWVHHIAHRPVLVVIGGESVQMA